MATEVADDELTPEEIEEQRRQRASQPIGKPIQAPASGSSTPTIGDAPQGEQSQTPLPKQDAPPEMSGQSPVTISGSQPIAPYPTPEQSRAATMEATPYKPKGGTIGRIADTIAGSTNIGRAVEEAGRFGTYGHMANVQGQEQAAAEEQGREKAAEGQQESQASVGQKEATAQEQQALAGQHQAQSHMVTLTLSDGRTLTMPQNDADRYLQSSATNTSKEGISANTNQTKENINKATVQGREDVADINAGKPQKPVQGTVAGKLAWGMYDPKAGWLDPETRKPIPGFTPPPNWAEGLTPVQITNEQGVPEVGAFHRDTGNITPTGNTSGTGPTASKIQSAHTLIRMMDNLNPLVQKMTQKGEFGIIQGRFSDWLDSNIGDAPEDVAQFHQLMNGVVSTMQSMYGFRRQEAVAELDRQLGARMTPESLGGALRGIVQHANSIIGPSGGGANQPTVQAPSGGLTIDRDANGLITGVR